MRKRDILLLLLGLAFALAACGPSHRGSGSSDPASSFDAATFDDATWKE